MIQFLNICRVLTIPFIPIYWLVVTVRNMLFTIGVFAESRVPAKVISVGNITVGGSGKTPFVIFITNLLKKNGNKVGVLSRGYGRESTGYVLVSDGFEMKTDVLKTGDEIYYTAAECKVPAAVSENRVKGARKLISASGISMLVLDDAFQHRWIHRDLNIVVFDQEYLNHSTGTQQWLMPAGNLREPMKALERADCIILNRKFAELEPMNADIKKYEQTGTKVFSASYKAHGFIDVRNNSFYAAEEFDGQQSLVVSGIANPASFIQALRTMGVKTDNRLVFVDHKKYTAENIQLIRKEFYSTNANSVITTQKDAVKLIEFRKDLDDIDIYYLKIDVELDDQPGFEEYITQKLDTKQKT